MPLTDSEKVLFTDSARQAIAEHLKASRDDMNLVVLDKGFHHHAKDFYLTDDDMCCMLVRMNVNLAEVLSNASDEADDETA